MKEDRPQPYHSLTSEISPNSWKGVLSSHRHGHRKATAKKKDPVRERQGIPYGPKEVEKRLSTTQWSLKSLVHILLLQKDVRVLLWYTNTGF